MCYGLVCSFACVGVRLCVCVCVWLCDCVCLLACAIVCVFVGLFVFGLFVCV